MGSLSRVSKKNKTIGARTTKRHLKNLLRGGDSRRRAHSKNNRQRGTVTRRHPTTPTTVKKKNKKELGKRWWAFKEGTAIKKGGVNEVTA